jgi:hypothetical protein
MRLLSISVACLLAVASVGCESAAPPTLTERAEYAPPPPEPAKPPDPPTEEELKAKAAAAVGGTANLEGQAAIAKAAALAAAKKKGRPAPPPAGAAPADGTPPSDAPPAADPQAPPAEGAPDPASPPQPEPQAGGTPPADQPPGPGDELTKAEAGVGVKGKDYGGPGFVTTPIETLFRVEDRIAFEVQIPSAMKLYKADHNNKGPKTHEEFINVIIKEHAVKLPDLPAGSVYWYDAKTEELMVRTPKPQ